MTRLQREASRRLHETGCKAKYDSMSEDLNIIHTDNIINYSKENQHAEEILFDLMRNNLFKNLL